MVIKFYDETIRVLKTRSKAATPSDKYGEPGNLTTPLWPLRAVQRAGANFSARIDARQ